MILHSSATYWSTGISLRWRPHSGSREINGQMVSVSGWSAKLDFLDDGFRDDDPDAGQVSTDGRLVTGSLWTRYAVPDGEITSGLSAAVDALIADAARLGITFKDPHLYYDGDGEGQDWPPPTGWRELLTAEAARIGWACPYGVAV